MSDLDRLRAEYADRALRLAADDRYAPFNLANLFAMQQRKRSLIQVLRAQGLVPLDKKSVLEVGCGTGDVLIEMLGLGVKANCLQGVDLLPDRLEAARERLPGINLLCTDGQHLPYHAHSFDIVLQFTVLSSILDRNVQRRLAQEMIRVVRPGGAILSYDFWLNPTNNQTVGIPPGRLRELFAGSSIEWTKVTLAPPISRRLVPISWLLAAFLENLRLFNTHYLAVIRPR